MASAQEHGKTYIVASSPTGKSATMLEGDSHLLTASATDRRQMYPLNYGHNGVTANENSKIWIRFKADADDIIESEESKMYLDVTLINISNGDQLMKTLTFEDFTGFTIADTTDINADAEAITDVCYYEVPSGSKLKLGWPNGLGKAYVYFGDDTA